jgi:hypothetical protein
MESEYANRMSRIFDRKTVDEVWTRLALPTYLSDLMLVAVDFVPVDRHDEFFAALEAAHRRFMETASS